MHFPRGPPHSTYAYPHASRDRGRRYPDEPRLLENATCALSNLMFGSDDNKLMIGQTCGDEIVHIIRMHSADAKLFKMALRALGNLSYCDANIRWIVNHGAAAVIVKGMDLYAKDEEGLQVRRA